MKLSLVQEGPNTETKKAEVSKAVKLWKLIKVVMEIGKTARSNQLRKCIILVVRELVFLRPVFLRTVCTANLY